MKASSPASLIVLAVLVVALTGCIGAMQTAPTDVAAVGGLTPTQEDKDVGLVGVAPGFELKTYRVIAVDRFAVADSEVKDADDRKLAQDMTTYLQSELVRRIRAGEMFARVVNLGETEMPAGGDRILRLRGVVSRLDPGSRALRYLVGFGAGRSKAQTTMQFVDAASDQTVMVVADRRVAAYGIFGGDSEEHLKESFDDMARDVAKFLQRLSRGEAPAKHDRSGPAPRR